MLNMHMPSKRLNTAQHIKTIQTTQTTQPFTKHVTRLCKRAVGLGLASVGYMHAAMIQAQTNMGGSSQNQAQNFSKVADNISNTLSTIKTLSITFCAVAGTILVGNSLFNLYKASKDPSHQVKPMAGIIGLIIGGLLVAVASVVTISQNTIVGG